MPLHSVTGRLVVSISLYMKSDSASEDIPTSDKHIINDGLKRIQIVQPLQPSTAPVHIK